MLKQLLKYEFKATSRVYGGLYLALALLSVVLGLSCRGQTLLPSNTGLWQFTVILSIVYAAVIAAIAVLCFVTTIQRFTKNLLGREGYLMHTLPVTETQLILSKLITSMVWVVVSILLGIVCITVMVGIGVFEPGMMDSLDWNSLRTMWRELKQQLGGFDLAGPALVGAGRSGTAGRNDPLHLRRLHDRAPVQASFHHRRDPGLRGDEHPPEQTGDPWNERRVPADRYPAG